MQPSWQDPKYGSKVRVALWLESEVGVGNIFTKTDLRDAFPGVAQIDRRLRDLRDHDWRIDTNRDDPALRAVEQRYVTKGAEIWIPGQAKIAKHKSSLSPTQRVKVWRDDNFICRTCGIGSGEVYDMGGVEVAQLNVARRTVRLTGDKVTHQLVTECKRCGAAAGDRTVELDALLALVDGLAPFERAVFAGWIAADRREQEPLEKLWGLYRTLPMESRSAIAQAVAAK